MIIFIYLFILSRKKSVLMKSKRWVQEVQALKREQIQQTQFQKTHKFWFAQTLKLILSRLYAQCTNSKSGI